MNLKKGPQRSILDADGYLFFPEINKEKLKKKLVGHKKVIKELEDFFKKIEFTPERINELTKLKKDLGDLKNLEKFESKTKHLDFLKEQEEEIEKFLKKK